MKRIILSLICLSISLSLLGCFSTKVAYREKDSNRVSVVKNYIVQDTKK
jgi:hypothetical protein